MQPSEIQDEFLRRVEEASGKPVLLQSDPKFSGHATIKTAREDKPAHLLLYKSEHEAELPYLVAFQCALALRIIEASDDARFDLASKPNLIPDVERLVGNHLKNNPSVPSHVAPELASQFAHGLGAQLRSTPIAICIDQQLYDQYPDLRPLQRRSNEQQMQEAMNALGPRTKAIAPQEIIDANVSMSAAYALFSSKLWDEPALSLPFISAGYERVGLELLAACHSLNSPDHDRELVDTWAKRLGLDRWFETVSRK